jgi:Tol biopolymer transport system component
VKPRALDHGQRSAVWVASVDGEIPRLLVETRDVLLEAPNWSLDGSALYANGAGKLWRIPLDGQPMTQVRLVGVSDINNDHVLAPDGDHIYLSANDWNIYRASLAGGPAKQITTAPPIPGLMHFLHGVSPDGSRLAFVGLETENGNWWAKANVFTVRADGTDYRQLTFGSAPADGCEYAPGGDWLYFNTEAFDGHAQIARIRPDGGDLQQLTFDDNVNWFPHLAPIGPYACYIAFPTGTQGHPPDIWVDLMLVENGRWPEARSTARVYGGQGTINVNSWSPDGRRFAYVSHDRDTPDVIGQPR